MIWIVTGGLAFLAMFVWGLIGHHRARRAGMRLAAARESHRSQFREQARIYAETVNRLGDSMTGAVQAAKVRESEVLTECERLAAQVALLMAENVTLRGTYRREVARG